MKTITQKYKQEVKKFKDVPAHEIPTTDQNEELKKDISVLLATLRKKIFVKNQKYVMKWAVGLERYIYSLSDSLQKPYKNTPSKGQILEIELFGHFNKEITFTHPAVVIKDLGNMQILVAPITSTYSPYNESYLIELNSEDGMSHTCYIKTNELITIHKNRVLYQHKNKAKENVQLSEFKLAQIDAMIINQYCPTYFNNEIDKSNSELNEEIKVLKEKIQLLEKMHS